MANLYRKSFLEKLEMPEQLDKAITITSPLSWLARCGDADRRRGKILAFWDPSDG